MAKTFSRDIKEWAKRIRSKPPTKEYCENYDRIFRKKNEEEETKDDSKQIPDRLH
jgi:hypothetical protein